MGRLSWIIQMSLKCNHKSLQGDSRGEFDYRRVRQKVVWWQKQWGIWGCYATGFGDKGQGQEPRNEKAIEAGKGKEIYSLLQSLKESALSASELWLSKTDLGLTSRTVGE